MTSIKQEILDELKNSPNKTRIKAKLMLALNRSDQSIDNYFEDNDPMLTQKDALIVICEETGKTESEILTQG